MSTATSAGERSRCYSHIVVHCSTWCVFMGKKKWKNKKAVCNGALPGKEQEGWTEGLFKMEEISDHLAQPPSQSFWFSCCCSAMVIWPLLISHPFHWPESLGSRIKCFLPLFKFLVSCNWVWLGCPPFSAHISTLHPTPVWVAGRICLSASWMNNWIGSSSKSHHPTAAMSF